MKVGIKLGKVKKFEIGWCIPHRMAADNTEGVFNLRYSVWENETDAQEMFATHDINTNCYLSKK